VEPEPRLEDMDLGDLWLGLAIEDKLKEGDFMG